MIQATIIILDYYKATKAVANVKSLLKQKVNFSYKIVLVDNSLNKKNAAILLGLAGVPNLDIVINDRNYGYPKAHNMVGAKIEGKYLFVVNPDIEWIQDNALQLMYDYLENNPRVGVLGPRHFLENQETEITARSFPKLYVQFCRRTFLRNFPFIRKQVEKDEMAGMNKDRIQAVDWLHSSCIAVRQELWQAVGGFDDRYFLFMSDTQLCWQAWELGYQVLYFPRAWVKSDGLRVSAGSLADFFKSRVLRVHFYDSLRFRLSHFWKKNPRNK